MDKINDIPYLFDCICNFLENIAVCWKQMNNYHNYLTASESLMVIINKINDLYLNVDQKYLDFFNWLPKGRLNISHGNASDSRIFQNIFLVLKSLFVVNELYLEKTIALIEDSPRCLLIEKQKHVENKNKPLEKSSKRRKIDHSDNEEINILNQNNQSLNEENSQLLQTLELKEQEINNLTQDNQSLGEKNAQLSKTLDENCDKIGLLKDENAELKKSLEGKEKWNKNMQSVMEKQEKEIKELKEKLKTLEEKTQNQEKTNFSQKGADSDGSSRENSNSI